MIALLKVFAWLVLGAYFAIAAVGGSIIAAFACLACGWFAGRHTESPLSEKETP